MLLICLAVYKTERTWTA